MNTVKVAEATNTQLDWLVAKCEGSWVLSLDSFVPHHRLGRMNFSTDWSQGGPIIEREKISVIHMEGTQHWVARKFQPACDTTPKSEGPTSLIAAMRCYVASKLGDEVDVPEGL